ncbi:MAG: hypothetical protein ACI4I3_10740 [Acutalibacteraceae bacterium]
MKNKALNTLLVISIAVLIVAALVFVFISIFNGTGSQWALQASIICAVLLNLLNVINIAIYKKK